MDLPIHQHSTDRYFQNKRIRQHLIKVGLINHRGDILPPKFYEVILAGRTNQRYAKGKIPHTIGNYVIEEEQNRHIFVRKELDSNMKRFRELKHRSMSNSLARIDQHPKGRNARISVRTSPKRSPVRAKSIHGPPINAKNLLVRRPSTAKQDEYCEVTMIYYGPQLSLDLNNGWLNPRGDEIVVMQQHCGGENLVVFKGFVKPNQIFTFESRRHPEYPFALSLHINGYIDSRISVCCEYKHKHNVRLGSKRGLFGIYDVQKSKPCRICRFEKQKQKKLPTSPITANPSPDRISTLSRSSSTSSFSFRTPSPPPEKRKEPPKSGINHISTTARTSSIPRTLSSASSQNRNKTDEYKKHNSMATFDNTSRTSDRQSFDGRTNSDGTLSRISSSTSRKSRPRSPIIPLKSEDLHYSTESLLARGSSDNKSSIVSRKSRPSPLIFSENEDDQHLLTLLTKNETLNAHSIRSSSRISSVKFNSSSQISLTNTQDDNPLRPSSITSSSTTIPIFNDEDDHNSSNTTIQHSTSSSSSDCSIKKKDEPHSSKIKTEKQTSSSSSSISKKSDRLPSSGWSTLSSKASESSHQCIINESDPGHLSISSTDIQQKNDTSSHNNDEDIKSNSASEHTRRNEGDESLTTNSSKRPAGLYRPVENIIVIWLDETVDNSDNDTFTSKAQLRETARTLRTFSNPEKCIQLIKEIKNEKIFLIVSGRLSVNILQQIDTYSQLAVVYIFCPENSKYEYLIANYPIIKGIYTDIGMICQHLKIDSKQWDNDLNTFQTISFIDTNQCDSKQLLFIQNQLFKEYLLEIENGSDAIHALSDYCRTLYRENENELESINQFEEDYDLNDALYWYTKDCFVYHMLNRAIRMKDIKILFRMAFFIRDINQQLEKLYATTKHSSTLTVFRGQGMKSEHFEELKQNQGGLLSFNGFLPTTTKQNIAHEFAQRSLSNGFPLAVLFRINIDATNTFTPYISLENLNSNQTEYEILFSFKTIFHIESIQQIENNLWQVDLTLINEKQHQLYQHIQTERNKFNHLSNYEKLGELLIEMNELNKAKDLYKINLPNISHPKYTYIYNQIAFIYTKLEDYNQAILYYNLLLQTKSNETLNDYVTISNIHNEIGEIFYKQNKIREALEKFQYALNIQLEHLSSTHPSLVNTYDLLAMMYEENDDYQTALEYHEKQLDIQEKSSLFYQSDLAVTHYKIAICLANLNRSNEAIDHAQQSIDMSSLNDPELSNRQAVLERIREQIE